MNCGTIQYLDFTTTARKVEVHVSSWMNHEYKFEQKAS